MKLLNMTLYSGEYHIPPNAKKSLNCKISQKAIHGISDCGIWMVESTPQSNAELLKILDMKLKGCSLSKSHMDSFKGFVFEMICHAAQFSGGSREFNGWLRSYFDEYFSDFFVIDEKNALPERSSGYFGMRMIALLFTQCFLQDTKNAFLDLGKQIPQRYHNMLSDFQQICEFEDEIQASFRASASAIFFTPDKLDVSVLNFGGLQTHILDLQNGLRIAVQKKCPPLAFQIPTQQDSIPKIYNITKKCNSPFLLISTSEKFRKLFHAENDDAFFSPLLMEGFLLQNIVNHSSMQDLEEEMQAFCQSLGEVAKECSLNMIAFGFADYEELKDFAKTCEKQMRNTYQLDSSPEDILYVNYTKKLQELKDERAEILDFLPSMEENDSYETYRKNRITGEIKEIIRCHFFDFMKFFYPERDLDSDDTSLIVQLKKEIHNQLTSLYRNEKNFDNLRRSWEQINAKVFDITDEEKIDFWVSQLIEQSLTNLEMTFPEIQGELNHLLKEYQKISLPQQTDDESMQEKLAQLERDITKYEQFEQAQNEMFAFLSANT